MLRLKENGNSYGDVSKYLTKNRHKTKSGGKWTRENVYSVLKTFMNNEKITPLFVQVIDERMNILSVINKSVSYGSYTKKQCEVLGKIGGNYFLDLQQLNTE